MRPGRPARAALTRLGWVGGVGLAGVTLARASGAEQNRWLIAAQGLSGWLLLPAHALAPLAMLLRSPRLGVLAAAVALYHHHLLRASRGRGAGTPPPAGATPVTVVTVNLLLTNPCIVAAGRQIAATGADIVALQELTPEHLGGLQRSGLLERYPHAVVDDRPGYHGSALLSRWPIRDGGLLDLRGRPTTQATVDTPDGLLRFVVVHASNPGAPGELHRWQQQLGDLAAEVHTGEVATVLVGDFNGTADHATFRRLLATGLIDAYHVAGRGQGATWPVWRWPTPALMRLDHLLVPATVAVSAARVDRTPGSDHAQLRATLHLVRGAAEAAVG